MDMSERDQFEAWFSSSFPTIHRMFERSGDGYLLPSTDAMWKSWQASREALKAEQGGDGWIACADRMPEIGTRNWRTPLPVLVKCEMGVIPAYYGFSWHEGEKCFGFMESLRYGDGSGHSPEDHSNGIMAHVSHWMPLPSSPATNHPIDTTPNQYDALGKGERQ